MSIHLVLLVLMLTSRVTIGKDVIQQNDNQPAEAKIDANSISSSTEMTGATHRDENDISNSTLKRIDTILTTPLIPTNLTTTTTTSTTTSNSKDSSNQTTEEQSAQPSQNEREIDDANKDLGLSSSISNFRTTTYRTVRKGAASQPNRDNKLMSLLAARRSALQRNPFRSHRRTETTNKTSIETTSKNPSDPRTSCERNCTKNFTRRTTASCMRRCVSLHNNMALSSTTTPSVRTKVDEKDNNEILQTDESSHGLYVVTKDLNDTVNHIPANGRTSQTSTEKAYKLRSKLRSPTLSVEEDDLAPYLFFGQKLPPLRPTVLRISKVDETHPKVLEVSVSKSPPDRNKIRSRYYPTRNIVAYNRRHGPSSFVRSTTSRTTTSPLPETDLKESSEEEFIRAETSQDNSTVNILVRSANDDSSRLIEETTPIVNLPSNLNETVVIIKKNMSEDVEQPPGQASTPWLINVPEMEEIITTTPLSIIEDQSTEIYPPFEMPEEKPNLIIFFNITTVKPEMITTPMASSTTTTTRTDQPVIETTSKSYTRTTISSSVRSTVNPVTSSIIPMSSTMSSLNSLNFTNIETFTQPSNVVLNFSVMHEGPTINVSENPDVNGIILDNSEVTIEMHRINMATYVLAGLGMFPIVIIILYVGKTIIFKRRSKDEGDPDHYASDGQPISPVRKMDNSDDERTEQYSIASDQDIERSNIRFKSLLGEGNFGQVWKAEVDDLSGHMGTTRIVAVKTVRTGSSQVGLKEEAEIMRKLGSHPNVVTLLGTCMETEPHLLVMEYAMRGRLLSLLRAARSATNILPASVPGGRSLAPLSPRTLAGFALDIARGMEYISEKKIVHRDLAARNVLLDHNGFCKICDFGMSIDLENITKTQPESRKADIIRQANGLENRFRFDIGGRFINQWNNHNNNNNINNNNTNQEKKHHDSVSKRPALPIRWMAPEALQYHIFSTETDIWAFGIVLWEIATLGCTPYPNLSGREVVRNVPNGTRPELPQDGRPEFYDLMNRCWRKDPRHRPTFREARIEISRSTCKWVDDDTATSDYMDVSGFSEDLEHGMVYFNRRISEFECEI